MESQPLRIANAHGFWGDRLEAASELLAVEPELDVLTFDFLAEVSMSILAAQREREGGAAFPRDFVEIVTSLTPYWRAGGKCRLIANAGGLDPDGCARACADVLESEGVDGTIAVVAGDDVLELLRTDAAGDPDRPELRNLDTGEPIGGVADRLVSANAYLGAGPISEGLDRGARIVVTGRVADASLVVGACLHHFRWDPSDLERLAAATTVGHLLECGTQLTGGLATDWLEVPGVDRIGFPVAEIGSDGAAILTKPEGTGGRVDAATVTEQLLYEVGDPDAYLTPDVTVSLTGVEIDVLGKDRVRVRGARGRPAPERLKVGATYRDGYWAAGQLTIFGPEAVRKARRAGRAVLMGLAADDVRFGEELVECLGADACRRGTEGAGTRELTETVLRIAVADPSREAMERFRRALSPLITAGPQGTTGYAEGRPRIRPLFRFWPCFIDRGRVAPEVRLVHTAPSPDSWGDSGVEGLMGGRSPVERKVYQASGGASEQDVSGIERGMPPGGGSPESRIRALGRLSDLAHGRSGDKGRNATISVIARRKADFPRLQEEVTVDRVASFLGIADPAQVRRFELPGLGALNFLIHGILDSPLRTDAQGKALGQLLLEMPLDPSGESGAGAGGARPDELQ